MSEIVSQFIDFGNLSRHVNDGSCRFFIMKNENIQHANFIFSIDFHLLFFLLKYRSRPINGDSGIVHRKGVPHVIYCRLWRWPELQSQNELKAFDNCEYAYHLKKDEICINPYHYMKVEQPQLAYVLVPKNIPTSSSTNDSISQYTLDELSNTVPNNVQYNALNLQQHAPYMEVTLNQQIPGNTTIMDSGNVSIGSVGSIPNTETPPPGYMSEDGDPIDQNDNMSELLLVSSTHNLINLIK